MLVPIPLYGAGSMVRESRTNRPSIVPAMYLRELKFFDLGLTKRTGLTFLISPLTTSLLQKSSGLGFSPAGHLALLLLPIVD